jgi:hypothetical protein
MERSGKTAHGVLPPLDVVTDCHYSRLIASQRLTWMWRNHQTPGEAFLIQTEWLNKRAPQRLFKP